MKTTYILPASTILVALVVATTGVGAATRDVDDFNGGKTDGISGDHPTTKCTVTYVSNYCHGYNKGYSDKTVSELD